MRYFRLNDDVHVPGRWHLGDVGTTPRAEVRFLNSLSIPSTIDLSVPVTTPGVPLDFCLTSFSVPIARKDLAATISLIAGADVQLVPIAIDGMSDLRDYAIPHCLRVVDCLDETKSEVLKWPRDANGHNANDRYRMVTNLKINRRKVPSDAHYFRVERWPVALIVSELVKDAMQRKGCLGAKFEQVD